MARGGKRGSPAGKQQQQQAAAVTDKGKGKAGSNEATKGGGKENKSTAATNGNGHQGKVGGGQVRAASGNGSESSEEEEEDESFEDAGSVAGSQSRGGDDEQRDGDNDAQDDDEGVKTPPAVPSTPSLSQRDDDNEDARTESAYSEGGEAAAATATATTATTATTKQEEDSGDDDDENRDAQFLLQRLDAQNNALQRDPRARTASMEGTQELRQSFARLQREAVGDPSTDWDFWGRVMSDYEGVASEHPKELSRAIQQGIPAALRGMTWQLMAASKDQSLETIYSELLKEVSSHEKSIQRDLSRTYPRHEYFQPGGPGQENLFNVVKAYSIYDEEVGYTQGLQFIVGPMLLNMPDEEAFCLLVRLMKAYDLRSHYVPNMPGLQLRLFQFDRLLEELLPSVFMHLLRQGIKSSMYASQWFLTLFGYRFPIELVCSVFDLIFAEGVEAVFRFAIAVLKKNEHKILALEFEDCIEFLKNSAYESYAPSKEAVAADPDALYDVQSFVKEALSIKITPLMLDQFGEEWENVCREQNAHNAEVDSLRRANAHLSQQVRQLESSLAQLNREHVDLVRQIVTSKIEREELEEELVKYKIAFADLSHQQAERRLSERQASVTSASASASTASSPSISS